MTTDLGMGDGGAGYLRPGDTRVERRFVVQRTLGEGGSAMVYEAIDRLADLRVALKVPHRNDPTSVERLRQEFDVWSGIRHPNLVRFHDWFADPEGVFFTMELVEGWPFDVHVQRVPEGVAGGDVESAITQVDSDSPDEASVLFDEARLRGALVQLVQGVGAIHATGRVHRDLKPSNVLVARDRRVVILDFHLSRPEWEAGSRLSVSGTTSHMAPEQAAEGVAVAASDWYSVGVMLYEALTGTAPFRGSALDVLLAKDELEPLAPSRLAPGIAPDLEALALDLLRRDPSRRPGLSEILSRL